MKKPEKKETEKKGKKFHTLRHQISMIFTAVLLFSIVTITVINGFFLEKYYISQKVEMLRKEISHPAPSDFYDFYGSSFIFHCNNYGYQRIFS